MKEKMINLLFKYERGFRYGYWILLFMIVGEMLDHPVWWMYVGSLGLFVLFVIRITLYVYTKPEDRYKPRFLFDFGHRFF